MRFADTLRLMQVILIAGSFTGCAAHSPNPLSLTPRLGGETPTVETTVIDRTAAEQLAPDVLAAVRKTADTVVAVSNPADTSYKIGPLDVLDISVFGVPELSKSLQVSEVGSIAFPLVGDVPAAGFTAREVEQSLARALGAKYLQRPQITVFIKEYNSQRVTIDGAVKRPGVFPVQGSVSLLQALALAQGMSEGSDETVVVFRTTNGMRSAARFDIANIRTGASSDPMLMAGDVVVAGRSAFKEGFHNLLRLVPAAGLFAIL